MVTAGAMMEYTLKFNEFGQLDGTQHVREEICDGRFILSEHQFFLDGEYRDGFIVVLDRKDLDKTHNFSTDDWGTMENTRNAAELACGGWTNFVVKPGRLPYVFNVLPCTEEAFLS